jgi:glycosyltransferase involved in cell wall biosynthesis
MNLNLIAPINQLGYGIAGLNILKTLDQRCNVSLSPLKPMQIVTQEDADLVTRCIRNTEKYDNTADCLRIWHQNDMSEFMGKGRHVGFPFFELDVFTDSEKHHLNNLDKLFVCSSWAKSICEKELSLPSDDIHVIPLGVDLSIFQPLQLQTENSDPETTVFFNCGKWEVRKGHDILYKIFNNTFDTSDKVELWMMCDNPFLSPEQTEEWQNLYKNSKLGDKIKFIPRVNTPLEVYNIMAQTDCGVFPSRAEGWNLELLEMLACGKTVITTNYSAHTAFCNSDNSLLVDIKDTELAFDGVWFKGTGSWASIGESQENEICGYMKQVHESKQKLGALPVNTDGLITAHNFNWDTTSQRILQCLKN